MSRCLLLVVSDVRLKLDDTQTQDFNEKLQVDDLAAQIEGFGVGCHTSAPIGLVLLRHTLKLLDHSFADERRTAMLLRCRIHPRLEFRVYADRDECVHDIRPC